MCVPGEEMLVFREILLTSMQYCRPVSVFLDPRLEVNRAPMKSPLSLSQPVTLFVENSS